MRAPGRPADTLVRAPFGPQARGCGTPHLTPLDAKTLLGSNRLENAEFNQVSPSTDLRGALPGDPPRVESGDLGTNLGSRVQTGLLGALNGRAVCRGKEKKAMVLPQRRAGRKFWKRMAKHQATKVGTFHILPPGEGTGFCTACLRGNRGSRARAQLQSWRADGLIPTREGKPSSFSLYSRIAKSIHVCKRAPYKL